MFENKDSAYVQDNHGGLGGSDPTQSGGVWAKGQLYIQATHNHCREVENIKKQKG